MSSDRAGMVARPPRLVDISTAAATGCFWAKGLQVMQVRQVRGILRENVWRNNRTTPGYLMATAT
jgi:hypothetical protein